MPPATEPARRPRPRPLAAGLCALLALALSPGAPASDPRPPAVRDAAAIRLALDKLNVVGSALYVGAHPDDENTALLAWLANGRKVEAAYLSMTRGDGGQNLIGSDTGELLGVIRTQELLAARRIDGAQQFFTRALDFGFSKGPGETLEKWGKDRILSDVVFVIRRYRPDVIIAGFGTVGGAGQHGHHTASAILAEEAFAAAADSTRFPEQLRWVRPWQAKRLVSNAGRIVAAGPPHHARAGCHRPQRLQRPARALVPSSPARRSAHTGQGLRRTSAAGRWSSADPRLACARPRTCSTA